MPKIEGWKELQSAKPPIMDGGTPAATQGPQRGSKLKMSIEKKIENIWLEFEELGWSYNDFISHLLEVLVVLNYRTLPSKLTPDPNPLQDKGNGPIAQSSGSLRVNRATA